MSKPERKKLPKFVTFADAMMTPRFVAFMRSKMRRWVMATTADQLATFRIERVVDFYLCHPETVRLWPLTLNAQIELENFLEERIEEIPRPLDFDSVVRGLLELPQGLSAHVVTPYRAHVSDIEAFNKEYLRYGRLFN